MNTTIPLYVFLDAPSDTAFERVKLNPWMLIRILQTNRELTIYFTHEEWRKIQQSFLYNIFSEEEKTIIESKLEESSSDI